MPLVVLASSIPARSAFWNRTSSARSPAFGSSGGVNCALGECTRIEPGGHRARFGVLTQDVVSSLIRSHDPVRADDTTLFSGSTALDSFRYGPRRSD